MIMSKNVILLYLCFLTFSVFSQDRIQRPKLVIGIVVDQMRQEYLFRFYEKFGKDGFKRLMNDGFMMRNAHYNYVPTYTGPGHASIYTGTIPRVHGVIANNWYDRTLGREINCVEDRSVNCVGGDTSFGAFSPANLLSTTITDELRIFTQNRAKVISASIKNRGAILPGGHSPNGAYWFDEVTNNFVTSTWYMKELPGWVNEFNKKEFVEKYMRGKWETILPIDQYTESTADDTAYELIWSGKEKPVFPYDLKKLKKENDFIEVFNHTPFGNDLLKDFAKEAVIQEQLGQDAITDFLAISFSATDRIGHKFGPNSVEIEDTYIRLDRNLAELFGFLDENIGIGEYTIFLTSDHGLADVARHMHDEKQPNWYITKKALKPIDESLNWKYGEGKWINYSQNYQIYLNDSLINARGLNKSEVIDFTKDIVNNIKGVSATYTAKNVAGYNIPHHEESMLSNGYHPSRSGDLMISFEPGWVYESSYYFKYGSPHGSAYTYDTHVPMIFYGWGIKKGSSVKYHPIIDIAPTLSMLLNIKLPNGATGHPIEEIFED